MIVVGNLVRRHCPQVRCACSAVTGHNISIGREHTVDVIVVVRIQQPRLVVNTGVVDGVCWRGAGYVGWFR